MQDCIRVEQLVSYAVLTGVTDEASVATGPDFPDRRIPLLERSESPPTTDRKDGRTKRQKTADMKREHEENLRERHGPWESVDASSLGIANQ